MCIVLCQLKWSPENKAAALLSTFSTNSNGVVARDGSGEFAKIAEAVAAAPDHSTEKYYIKIKSGTYVEHIRIGMEKTNLVFVGDGMDVTIITNSRSNHTGYSIFESATVDVEGDGFVAKGITFMNSAGPNNGQAVAMKSSSNLSAFYRCRFQGYQDTLFVEKGLQFYRDSEIYGNTDFIFGNAAAVFQNCHIFVLNPTTNHACVITAQGRSFLDDLIDPMGWLQWNNVNPQHSSLYYGEYQNQGPGADTSDRVNWKGVKVLDFTEAKLFTVRNFIKGQNWIPLTNIPFLPDLKQSLL
ncbi:hypothetical protein POM88_018524 [Heracleum sosnowskyi]|uniref:Pectinesterase catalytic domain-containing protein n=1 Tax=Heracleum sosnowskyi TaxID=360622 RepID=A0AAD8MZB6_9APIA|nr:hypothetical protein POM88_018524 [Heracleum sosnowskyi]